MTFRRISDVLLDGFCFFLFWGSDLINKINYAPYLLKILKLKNRLLTKKLNAYMFIL